MNDKNKASVQPPLTEERTNESKDFSLVAAVEVLHPTKLEVKGCIIKYKKACLIKNPTKALAEAAKKRPGDFKVIYA